MIKEIEIQNFKSIVKLKLELGRFNVLIGENGSGKTNILEAITFAGAAMQDKLDHEFLFSRGIRVADKQMFFSRFGSKRKNKIKLAYIDEKDKQSKINVKSRVSSNAKFEVENYAVVNTKVKELVKLITSNNLKNFEDLEGKKIKGFENIDSALSNFDLKSLGDIGNEFEEILNFLAKKTIKQQLKNEDILSFLNFSPDYSCLRNFDAENQIEPLGINGEGVLRFFLDNYKKKKIKPEKLNAFLSLLGWFKSIDIDSSESSYNQLKLYDKYISSKISGFNYRSTNEGFLFLLFYFMLFTSKETPKFFAIDNIEAAFNPKLCRALTVQLIKFSKLHKKQAIVTTHNPAVLDALDLEDDSICLYVIRRNEFGYTIADRITKKTSKIKLSEAWMKGLIGGLPNNF